MTGNLGVYIHIPFCRSKCPYCDFFSFRAKKEEINAYVDILCDKIKMWGNKTDKIVDTVYLGGGTPSILGAESCCRIINTVKDNFKVTDDCEITIEANPSSGKFFDFKKAYDNGINRVSLGVQSVNENELKKLGRIHSREDVENTISLIKNSGIDNFSLDLMIGIPEQTTDSLKKSIDFCINSGAKHISSYMLKIEENTVFYNRRGNYIFPDDDLTADMYLFAVDYLSENGFRQYEISNFAKTGYESKHNNKYWLLDDYLGIGPAAHSMMDGKRFYYNRSVEDFKNDVIISDGTAGDLYEYIMLRLRLAEGIDIAQTEKAFGVKLSESFLKSIDLFCKNGFMKRCGDKCCFTPKGFLMSNSIIAELSNKI